MSLQCKRLSVDCQVLRTTHFFQHTAAAAALEVSLLIGHSLGADVSVVFVGDGDRLVVADDAVKSFKFRVATVYTPTPLVRGLLFRPLRRSSTIRNS